MAGDRRPRPDLDQVKAYALNVWRYKQGEMVALMIHIGDRLGLYKALDRAGPVSAAELAARTGLHQRWLLEWLRGQAAANILEYHRGDRFELTATGSQVMADEESSLFFSAGAFGEPRGGAYVERLAQAFRTGVGLTYEELGPEAAHQTERMLGPWTRLALVPEILPALDGVTEKLEAGAVVADVGCGSGVAVLAMAEVYPASRFHGYDPSANAIERAREQARERGIENATFHLAGGEELPEAATFDLVLTLDCVHDMTRPAEVIAAIRRAIKQDGSWLIKDIRSQPEFEANRKNPLLAMFYGFSVSTCMSSAMSEPGGAGLGTLGFNPVVARQMTAAGGFTRFKLHDFKEPANLYYEVRP